MLRNDFLPRLARTGAFAVAKLRNHSEMNIILKLLLSSSCVLLWVLHKVGVKHSECGTDLGAFEASGARHSWSVGCQDGNFVKIC